MTNGTRADLFRSLLAYPARLYRRAVWRLLARLHEHVTISTPQGVFRVSTRDNTVAKCLYTTKQFEYGFSCRCVEFLKRQGFVNSNAVCMLDVGANVGVISIGLLRAGLIRKAIAIEPEPRNFRLLQENVALNGLADRMSCVQRAMSERGGRVALERSPRNHGDHRITGANPLTACELYSESKRERIEVEAVTLDELARRAPCAAWDDCLLWIDVQGHEGYVFRGGERLLARGIPAVSEVWPYGILRAGMNLEEFSRIVTGFWTHFWVENQGLFRAAPIASFGSYVDDLGIGGRFGNVIFTRSKGRE